MFKDGVLGFFAASGQFHGSAWSFSVLLFGNLTHCGWASEILHHQKDGSNPINNGINDLSTGAGIRNHPQ